MFVLWTSLYSSNISLLYRKIKLTITLKLRRSHDLLKHFDILATFYVYLLATTFVLCLSLFSFRFNLALSYFMLFIESSIELLAFCFMCHKLQN